MFVGSTFVIGVRGELSHDTGSVTTGVTVVVPVAEAITHTQSKVFPDLSPSGHESITSDVERPHPIGTYLFVIVQVLLSPGKRTTIPVEEQSHMNVAVYDHDKFSVTEYVSAYNE